MKLPIILSAMIAALAIPGSLADDAMDAAKADTTAPGVPPKATDGHHDKHHGKKGKHHGHKRHGHHRSNSPQGPYRGSWDDMQLRAADGDVNRDLSPKAGSQVVPGHKTR